MSAERAIGHTQGARSPLHNPDQRIGDLAEAQHGFVARRQLLALGVGRRSIAHRLRRGRLRRDTPGVYAVGHRPVTAEGRLMAAVLAGGDGAVLHRRSAAMLWGLRVTAPAIPEVTKRPISADEVTTRRGIPVTTVPRTLLDLAAVLSADRLERALHEAEHLRLTDPLSLVDLLERHPGRRGIGRLRAILATQDLGADVTRSELEDAFTGLIAHHGLPRPLLNRLVEGFLVDAVWPAHRLVVELDGHASHATRKRFESDRARDRALAVAGWRVVRITWRQLHGDPGAIAADLGVMLTPPRTTL